MLKLLLSPLPLVLIFLCSTDSVCAQSSAQAPVAQPPAQAPAAHPLVPSPSGPPNITAILDKSKQFSTLIRLLKSTQLDAQLYKQLNDSSQTMTLFAPTDSAFGSLKAGALNSFSDQQKFQLIKFHLISSVYSIPAFQTASNPVSTQAGSTGLYPLNITVSGNQVNISTGIVNATVSNTIYSDNQLAVYEVDHVLLPLSFFATAPSPSPSPAAAVSTPKKKAPSSSGSSAGAGAGAGAGAAAAPTNTNTTTTTTTTTPSTDASASVQSSGAIQRGLGAMSFAGFIIVLALSLCI